MVMSKHNIILLGTPLNTFYKGFTDIRCLLLPLQICSLIWGRSTEILEIVNKSHKLLIIATFYDPFINKS